MPDVAPSSRSEIVVVRREKERKAGGKEWKVVHDRQLVAALKEWRVWVYMLRVRGCAADGMVGTAGSVSCRVAAAPTS